MIPTFHDYHLEPKIKKCGDLLYATPELISFLCLILKPCVLRPIVVINRTNLKSDALNFEPCFKMTISGPFLVIFCRLLGYFSQKLGSDGHFEVFNISKT